jgi:hypothetical protein
LDGKVKIRGTILQPVSKETFGSDAGDCNRLGVQEKCAADHGAVAGIIVLPLLVAHDGDGWRSLHIVSIGEEAAGAGRQTERSEIIAGDKLAHNRPRIFTSSIAPDHKRPVAKSSLHPRQFLKLRRVLPDLLVRVGGEHRKVTVIAGAKGDAAYRLVAEFHQR